MTNQTIQPFWKGNTGLITLCQALDYHVRLVGGCVRDAIIGKTISDIDLATPLTPDDVTKHLTAAGIRVVPTGLTFGTVTAVIEGTHYEITTLRKDIICDGRHAQVSFTTDYQQDAARRDFTLNAMSCDLSGTIYDYYGGWGDALQGKIRFVGEASKRCEEDILRILRFFRFYAHYGTGPADRDALQACQALAPRIRELSGERIQAEIIKLLTAPHPFATLRTMEDCGVCPYVFGLSPSEASWKALERQLKHEIRYDLPILPWLRLAHLLTQPEEAGYLASRWKLSHMHRNVLYTLLSAPAATGIELPDHYRLVRNYGKEIYAAMLRLRWARTDTLPDTDTSFHTLLTKIQQWEIPAFPLKGSDLLALGIPPGKEMGHLLKQAEQYWEESSYQPDRTQLLAQVHHAFNASREA